MKNIREIFLSIISGILLAFSFPNANCWIFAWVAFIPLLFALRDKTKTSTILLSYLSGLIFWSLVIYWLIHVTLPGTIVLILYLALYHAAFGLGCYFAQKKKKVSPVFSLAAWWVILEYVRSQFLTGFPWALIGYSQYKRLAVIQISDITGIYGVSFLIVMGNVTIFYLLSKNKHLSRKIVNYAFFLLLAVVLLYGLLKVYRIRQQEPESFLKVCVIQGNISQDHKWDGRFQADILDKYSRLTREAAKDSPELIVWPEASSPAILGEDDLAFKKIFSLGREIGIPLVIGAVRNERGKYFNSALLLDKRGIVEDYYNKLHLVPFGEYIPLKNVLPFLATIVPIGDISPGKEYTVFSQKGQGFSVLICFEDLFPELSAEFKKRGADFLINITNDAWYKKSSAPYQHLQASVFRAIENRLYLVRAANTGISAFIDPAGMITSMVKDKSGKDIFVDGFKSQNIPIIHNPLTFYSRHGDLFIGVCLSIVLIFALM